MKRDPNIKREELARRKQIGARIRERRLELRLQAIDVAAAVDMNKSEFSRVETGKRPASTYLPRIAPVLKTTVGYLLTGQKPDDQGAGDREELFRITVIVDRVKR